MKTKTSIIFVLIIVTALLALIIVGSLFLMPSRDIKQEGVNTVLGNDYANLSVGGTIAKKGDMVYYSRFSKSAIFNKLFAYNLRTKKTESLKTFIISRPVGLCVASDYIFFFKGVVYGGSSLYRMNLSGGACEEIISDVVGQYNIYLDNIYYTVDSPASADDVGLFRCDINGEHKKRIIDTEVTEFVFVENDIYYIQNNSVRRHNSDDDTDIEIKSYSKCSLYNLTVNNKELFFTKTDDIDQDKQSLVRINLGDNTETVLYDGVCGLFHIFGNVVIFRAEDEYYYLNLSDLTVTPFVKYYNISEGRDITELYTFDSDCFFLVETGNKDKLIHLDLSSEKSFIIDE